MTDKRKWNNLYVFIATAVSACCLLLTIPMIMTSFRSSGNLVNETVARKIAYCAWLDPSLSAVHYPVNTLVVILACWAPAALALGVSLGIGYPKWYIPVFVVATCATGTLLFAPQLLAHYHFRVPSTNYLIRNIGVSAVFSAVTVGIVFLHHLRTAKEHPRKMLIACSYLWILVAFHCVASFFYIFSLFAAVE